MGFTRCRQFGFRWIKALSVLLAGTSGAKCAAKVAGTVRYPGPAIGPARVQVRGQTITVSNAALSLSWTLTPNGLAVQSVRDAQLKKSLPLKGEVFQIVLTNGQRYVASALTPEAKPRASKLTPDPKAARLAARIPGRQVELPQRSADGRLRVVWRALLHDGANYARQKITVTAAGGDCAIQEIIWFDETIPGARSIGRVASRPASRSRAAA